MPHNYSALFAPFTLTIDEIRRMNDDFAQSAARLKRCGFSGVEISAGHGHLFHQFLSPWSNVREDEYGGDVELVALGRALVADPAWPVKAAHGRAHDIRYCVSCNNCWYVGAAFHQSLACDNNPRVARPDEVDYWPQPIAAPAKKRMVIVGAGVAGMEAAWTAASARKASTSNCSRGRCGARHLKTANWNSCRSIPAKKPCCVT